MSSPQGSGGLFLFHHIGATQRAPHQSGQDVHRTFNDKNKPLAFQEAATLGFGNASVGPTESPRAVSGVSLDNSSVSQHDNSDHEVETVRAPTPRPGLQHEAEEENQLAMTAIDVITAATSPVASSYDGDLVGLPPDLFDGTQSESKGFLFRFQLYHKVNARNEIMKDPFTRVTLALSYMKGPKINYWVSDQWEKRKMARNDEDVWNGFIKDFEATFTDPFFKDIAAAKLKALKMEGNDLEGYIATFGGLLFDAEWGREEPLTMRYFYKGLGRKLFSAIVDHYENLPANIDQGIKAAREEHSRFAYLRLLGQPRNPRHQDHSHRDRIESGQNDGIASADKDMPPLRRLTREEREKLKAEGRCFRCRQEGHVTRDCPKGQQGPHRA